MKPKEAKEAYEEAEKVLKKITGGRPNQDYALVITKIGVICYFLAFYQYQYIYLYYMFMQSVNIKDNYKIITCYI